MRYIACILLGTLLFACTKEKGTNDAGNYPSNLKGTIYYKWATEGIISVDFPSGTGGSFIQNDSRVNSFDISRDGKLRLTAVNASTLGNYVVKFTLSNQSDGSIVQEFNYTSPARNSYCKGQLSPDNSMILVQSNDEIDGVTVLKTDGEFVVRVEGVGGQPFGMHDMAMWLPGNELLLTHGKNIYRIPPPYTSGSLVRVMNYTDWGDLSVNQQGTKMAVRIDRHINTMNMDGSGLTQVTTSNFKESKPIFSPDNNYLMVGSNYRQSSVMGHSWDIKIIPNDGKQYNVDPEAPNTAGVIPVFWKGKDRIETGSGQVIWR